MVSMSSPKLFYCPAQVRPWSGLEVGGQWRPSSVTNGGYGFICAFTSRDEAEAAYPGVPIMEFRNVDEVADEA